MPILATHDLTKRYGTGVAHPVALDRVSLVVPEGGVFGLVGPNGAGKTTLLSIVAGLRSPTSGTVDLRVRPDELAVCPDVPEFEPWLTATEVLQLSASLGGNDARAPEIAALLEQAGLAAAAGRRVGGFSRGMTQRLALAVAVVTNPRLIVLDEPCAALDPAGRVEVLDLITHLATRCTVIFSSHILGDVQRVADSVGVLRLGRLLYQGPLETLLAEHVTPAWLVHVREPAGPVVTALGAEPWVRAVTDAGEGRIRVEAGSVADAEAYLSGALSRAGARVVALAPESADLESVFLTMTGQPDR